MTTKISGKLAQSTNLGFCCNQVKWSISLILLRIKTFFCTLSSALLCCILALTMAACKDSTSQLPEGTENGGPSAPRSVEVISGNLSLQFRWQPPENEGLSQITRYEYDLDGRNVWKSMGTRSPYYLEGLTNDKTYMVRIRAVNSNATGVISEGVFGVPSPHRTSSKERICKSGGDGSSAQNPYILCHYADLKALHDYYKEKGSIFEMHIALGKHIDATPSHREGTPNCSPFRGNNAHEGSTCRGWKPLPPLRDGSFYGRGFTIFGLYSSRFQEDKVGLFSEITHRTQIRDVHLREVSIYSYSKGRSYVGAFAGQSYYSAVVEYSSVAGGRIDGPYVVGGLIGEVDGAQIHNSYVQDSPFTRLKIAGRIVGGVAGRLIRGSTVHSTASAAQIIGNAGEDDDIYVGGLVGELDDSQLMFSRSLSDINSQGSGASVVGWIHGGSTIKATLGAGKVIARGDHRGGFCGRSDGSHDIKEYVFWDRTVTQQQEDACEATSLRTADITKSCGSDDSADICDLKKKTKGFRFSSGAYPQPLQCIRNCSVHRTPAFGRNIIFSVPRKDP